MNRRNSDLDHLIFRIALARQLIDEYSSRKRKGLLASFQDKKCVVPDDERLASVGNHMPKMVSKYRRYIISYKEIIRSRSFETEVRDLEQLRQDLIGRTYGDENSEYEELDEKENDRPQSQRNLIDLLRRQVMMPILKDRIY
ncbi:piggyBac transposable element-derived protein 4 [Trichonephila clavipes]|nr:piggyBac transposable element-derived protein 4 [Trichonephila clavipes]